MEGLRELALFAGAGGGILGGKLLGWRCVCAVEIEAYCREILMRRQNEGHLQPFPIWDDVTTFDGHPWRGKVDVVSGGFPCQDISTAGKGAGLDGERSGLWGEMARIIGEVRPRFAFVENSPALTSRGLHRVLGDLAELGYDCKWGIVSAADVGAPHLRKRIWIVAHTRQERQRQPETREMEQSRGAEPVSASNVEADRATAGQPEGMADTTSSGLSKRGQASQQTSETESGTGLVDEPERCCSEIPNTSRQRQQRQGQRLDTSNQAPDTEGQTSYAQHDGFGREWPVEPQLGRVADGVANRVDRLTALGNGQVPRVVAAAWNLLTEKVRR